MVGIFSRFSVRSSHRRAQSALDERYESPRNSEAMTDSTVAASATNLGVEPAVQFKPVEHPTEPLNSDLPIRCPIPEPSILNDGRIWKERVSLGIPKRGDTPTLQDQSPVEAQAPGTRHRPPNPGILPSNSAPEHNLLQLLEEYNASGIHFNT